MTLTLSSRPGHEPEIGAPNLVEIGQSSYQESLGGGVSKMDESLSDDAEYYEMVMRPIERFLTEVFEHPRSEAKLYVRAFYEAARDGQLYPVPWTDEDIQHEGVGLAFAVQYHMTQPGKRRPHSPTFLHWRAACDTALREGRALPPVPEADI